VFDFNVHGSVHLNPLSAELNPICHLLALLGAHHIFHVSRIRVKNILIYVYVQQDSTLYSLFYLESALHVSGGTIIHHQERKQLYLQHLVFVTP